MYESHPNSRCTRRTGCARSAWLEKNSRGAYTTSSPLQYPNQWNWDAMFCSILHQADQDSVVLGRALHFDTREMEDWLEKTRAVFERRFWNEERRLFFDYDVRAGKSIPVNTFAALTPLYAAQALDFVEMAR